MRLLLVLLVTSGACTAPPAVPFSPDIGYLEAPTPRSADRIGPIAEGVGNIQITDLGSSPQGVLALARDHDEGRPPFFLLRYDEALARFSRVWLPTAGLRGFGAAFAVGPDGSAWIALDGGPTKPQTLMRVWPDGSVDEWPIPPVAYPRVVPGADSPRIYPQIADLVLVGQEVFVARHEQLELTIFDVPTARWEQPQTPPGTGVITNLTSGPEGRLYLAVEHRRPRIFGTEIGVLDPRTRGITFWETSHAVLAGGARSLVVAREGQMLRLDASGTVTASTPLERPTQVYNPVLLRSDDVAVRQVGWEVIHYDAAGREIGRVSWAPPERHLRGAQAAWGTWTKDARDTIWFTSGRRLYRASFEIVGGRALLRDAAPPVYPLPAAVRCDVPVPSAGATVARIGAWSADGRTLLVESVSGQGPRSQRRGIGGLDVATGRVREIAPDGTAPLWSGSGRLIAYKVFQSPTGPGIAETIVIVDSGSGSRRARIEGTAGALAWAGDALRYLSGGVIREWRDGTDRELAPLTLSTGAAVPSELFYDFSPDGERLLAQHWALLASGESHLQATHVATAHDGVLRPLDAPANAQWSGARTLFVTRPDAYELRTDTEVRTIGADAVPGQWLGGFDHRGRPLFGARRSNDFPDELTIAFTRATPWDGERLGDPVLIPQALGNTMRFSPDGRTVAMTSRLHRSIDLSIFACR